MIPTGGSWTTARRTAFLKAFEAMLDFTIEIDDTPKEPDPEVSEQEVSP